jgi:hypothetical protein
MGLISSRTVCLSLITTLFALNSRGVIAEEISIEPQKQCAVEVELYFDMSLSVGPQILIDGVNGLLKEQNSPFPASTTIKLSRFANRPLDPIELDKSGLLSDKIIQGNIPPDFDRNETNLLSVLHEIIGHANSIDPIYKVFVVASDFKHDPLNRTDDAAISQYQNSILEFFGRHGAALAEAFKPGSNRGLILLTTENTPQSLIIDNLMRLNHGRSQIVRFLLNKNIFQNYDFLSYLQPLEVKVSRSGTINEKSDQAKFTTTVHARSGECLKQIDHLYYGLYFAQDASEAPRELSRFKNLELKKVHADDKEWSDNQTISKSDLPPLSREPNGIANEEEIQAYVRWEKQGGAQENFRLVQVGVAHLRDYLVVRHFEGLPTVSNDGFDMGFTVKGENNGPQDVTPLRFELLCSSAVLGDSASNLNADEQPVVKKSELAKNNDQTAKGSFKLSVENLAEICAYESKESKHLFMRITGGLVTKESRCLSVHINRNHNGNPEHLLRTLFEQASLPALITIYLTLIFAWKRADEIEKIEKLMAVFVIASTTLSILLHQHVGPAKLIMDDLLEGWPSIFVAFAIIVGFWLLAVRIIQRGGLPLSKGFRADVAHFIDMDARGKSLGITAKNSPWRSRIFWVGVVTMASVALIVFVIRSPEREFCSISGDLTLGANDVYPNPLCDKP